MIYGEHYNSASQSRSQGKPSRFCEPQVRKTISHRNVSTIFYSLSQKVSPIYDELFQQMPSVSAYTWSMVDVSGQNYVYKESQRVGLNVLLVLRNKARLYFLGIDAVRRVRFQPPFNASGCWNDEVRGKMLVEKVV